MLLRGKKNADKNGIACAIISLHRELYFVFLQLSGYNLFHFGRAGTEPAVVVENGKLLWVLKFVISLKIGSSKFVWYMGMIKHATKAKTALECDGIVTADYLSHFLSILVG